MNLKDALSVLVIGSSPKEYPFYAPYVFSDGENLRTCNDSIYVHMDYPATFEGSVNITVLFNLLKAIDPEEYSLIQKDKETLLLESDKSVSELCIFDLEFPKIEITPSELETFSISEELERDFNKASLFVGQDNLAPVYVNSDCICATARNQLFYAPQELPLSKLGLTKENIKLIHAGYEVAEKEGNFILLFDGGYIAMTTSLVDTYPIEKIKKFVDEVSTGMRKVCNFAVFEDAIKYLSSIFTNTDKEKNVTLECKEGVLTLSTKSVFSGESSYSYEIENDMKFSINIPLLYLKKLDISYDLYYNDDKNNVLIFHNDKNIIALQGELV